MTFDQQEIVKELTDFYQFLATLPYIDPGAILYPPSSGWPNVTQENFAPLGKNDDVINLLKNLPCIDQSKIQYTIAPDTNLTDYCGPDFKIGATERQIRGAEPPGDDVPFPSWVIALTYGGRDATCLMLDTTDGKDRFPGTVTEYNVQDGEEERYGEDDPRSWRNHCEGESQPLTALLNDWKDKYYTLEWMGPPQTIGYQDIKCAEPDDPEYEQVEQMREIYRKHDWPNSFDREACKQALIDWQRSSYDSC